MKLKQSIIKTLSRLCLGFLSGASLLTSCIVEDIEQGNSKSGTGKEVNVHFTVQMPRAGEPGSYAISRIDENEVKEIDIFSFKPDATKPSGYAFAYRAKVSGSITDSGDNLLKKNFTVTLIKDKDNEQNLVLLANVRSLIDELEQEGMAEGADKDALLARLVFENAGSWNANNGKSEDADDKSFTPFPMWGEVKKTVNDETTAISDAKLVRGIARVDVVLAEAVITKGNFTIEEVYVYNSKNAGQVVPAPDNIEKDAEGNILPKVKEATVPAAAANNGRLDYIVPADKKTLYEREIYLFEAKTVAQSQSSEATCFVVGGKFGTDTDVTYYRLDIFARDADGKQINAFRDICRNHQYRLNIINVKDRGYDTPEDAFNANAVNMEVEVTVWDESIIDVTFNGSYFFGTSVENRHLILSSDSIPAYPVYVTTDYPSGWKITSIVDGNDDVLFDGTDWAATPWFKTDIVKGNGSERSTMNLTLTENTDDTKERYVFVNMAAGNLIYTFKVTQKPSDQIDLMVTDESGNDLNGRTLEFQSKNAVAQSFKVTWKPKGKDVAVVVAGLPGAGASGFVFDGANSIENGTLVGSTENGTKTYTIKPTDITAGEPYAYKSSVAMFTLTDGKGNNIVKTLFFAQGNFSIAVVNKDDNDRPYKDNEIYLPLDGEEYRIKVKANTQWEIKEVSAIRAKDGGVGVDFLDSAFDDTQNGVGDPVNGEYILVNPKSITAMKTANPTITDFNGYYFTVTLQSKAGAPQAEDVTIKIISANCGVNGSSIKQKIGNNYYKTHYYGTGANRKCWMVENSKEGGGISTYPGYTAGERGYYYSVSGMYSACPSGWKVPTSGEAYSLITEIGTSSKANAGPWYSASPAGTYDSYNNPNWHGWNSRETLWTQSNAQVQTRLGKWLWNRTQTSTQSGYGWYQGDIGATDDLWRLRAPVRCVRIAN